MKFSIRLPEQRQGTRWSAVCCLLLAAALWMPGGTAMAQGQDAAFVLQGRAVRVVDGDTFTLDTGKRREQIRLASIDAPEIGREGRPGQPMAQASRKALSALVQGRRLQLDCYERDNYGRSICDVRLPDGGTANQRQVERGMAWANMEKRGRFLRDDSLPRKQDQARQQRLGIWSMQGAVQPWVWRYQCWRKKVC